jgi:hypothetical protein
MSARRRAKVEDSLTSIADELRNSKDHYGVKYEWECIDMNLPNGYIRRMNKFRDLFTTERGGVRYFGMIMEFCVSYCIRLKTGQIPRLSDNETLICNGTTSAKKLDKSRISSLLGCKNSEIVSAFNRCLLVEELGKLTYEPLILYVVEHKSANSATLKIAAEYLHQNSVNLFEDLYHSINSTLHLQDITEIVWARELTTMDECCRFDLECNDMLIDIKCCSRDTYLEKGFWQVVTYAYMIKDNGGTINRGILLNPIEGSGTIYVFDLTTLRTEELSCKLMCDFAKYCIDHCPDIDEHPEKGELLFDIIKEYYRRAEKTLEYSEDRVFSRLDELKRALAQEQQANHKQKQEIDDLNSQVALLNQNNQNLTLKCQRVDELEDILADRTEQITVQDHTIKTLSKLLSDNDRVVQELHDLTEQFEQSKETIQTLRRQVDTLLNSLAKRDKEIQGKKLLIESQQRIIQEQRSLLDKTNTTVSPVKSSEMSNTEVESSPSLKDDPVLDIGDEPVKKDDCIIS